MSEEQKIAYYETPLALDEACNQFIKETDRVLDVGCGIRPQKYFKPYLHVCLEPFQEYIDILELFYSNDPGFLILSGMALDTLKSVPDKSFDSVFLIDVIEHIEKEDGVILIKELERVAKKQVLIFTPLGFMPQQYEEGDTDAWGLSGTELQEHKSGWEPKDFDDRWEFHVCREYHKPVVKTEDDTMFGAFWGVLNIEQTKAEIEPSEKILLIAESIETTFSRMIKLHNTMNGALSQNSYLITLSNEIKPTTSSLPKVLRSITVLRRIEKMVKIFSLIRKSKKIISYNKIVYFKDSDSTARYIKFLASKTGVAYEEIDV